MSSDGSSPLSAPSPEESHSAAPSPTSHSLHAVQLLQWKPGVICGFIVSVL